MDDVLVSYNGQVIGVSQEVAAFLEADRKRQQREERSDRRHIVPMWRVDPDAMLETKHHTGHNYLLNRIIRQERQQAATIAIRGLSADQQRLFMLRYEREMTQREIGNLLGISKMAVCKRIRKLENRFKAALPNWSAEDFMVGGV